MKLIPVFALSPLIKIAYAQTGATPADPEVYCYGPDCPDAVDNFPLFRADSFDNDFGTKALVKMIRNLMCYKHQSSKPLHKCNVSIDGIHLALRNFGCNCHPANFDGPGASASATSSWHMGSNGRPLNELDAQCQKLHNAYTCLDNDRKEGLYVDIDDASPYLNKKCGRFTDYTWHSTVADGILCSTRDNPDYVNSITPEQECQFAACKIEREFAVSIYELLGANAFHFKNNNPSLYDVYDDASICKKRGSNNVSPNVTCCGEFPARQPYNDLLKQCCSDGTTQSLGTCS